MSEEDCLEAVHTLYHYLDGELTEERRVIIRAHLELCGSCLTAFDFEMELRRVLAERCRDQVPPGLMERIAGVIHHDPGAGGPADEEAGGEGQAGRGIGASGDRG